MAAVIECPSINWGRRAACPTHAAAATQLFTFITDSDSGECSSCYYPQANLRVETKLKLKLMGGEKMNGEVVGDVGEKESGTSAASKSRSRPNQRWQSCRRFLGSGVSGVAF